MKVKLKVKLKLKFEKVSRSKVEGKVEVRQRLVNRSG